jgi:hypothetical protein
MTDFDITQYDTLESSASCGTVPFDHYQILEDSSNFYNSNILPVDEIALVNCPPQGIAPSDLNKVIGNLTAELEVKKYYVSELIGIKAGDEPLFEVFPTDVNNMPASKQENAKDFISKIFQLINGNDLCDKQGIKFIGKYLRHYCPNSENYNNLNSQQAQFIDHLYQSVAPVVELATKWANCK